MKFSTEHRTPFGLVVNPCHANKVTFVGEDQKRVEVTIDQDGNLVVRADLGVRVITCHPPSNREN